MGSNPDQFGPALYSPSISIPPPPGEEPAAAADLLRGAVRGGVPVIEAGPKNRVKI
jgi:hypothetical protein